MYDELGRLEGPQSHAVICQAFLRAGVWLDVRIRAPDETGSGTGAVGVMEWRRPNYRVIYSADLVHIGAKLDNEWVVMLAGEVDRLIAEGLVDRASAGSPSAVLRSPPGAAGQRTRVGAARGRLRDRPGAGPIAPGVAGPDLVIARPRPCGRATSVAWQFR